MDDDEDKTEEPTAKRLEDARKKGQIPNSREINNWFVILGMIITFGFLGKWIMVSLADIMVHPFIALNDIPSDDKGLTLYLMEISIEVAKITALPIFIALAFGLLASFSQTNFIFTVEQMKPKLEKISPIAGFKRLFSMRQLVEFAKGILKIGMVATIGAVILAPEFSRMDILPSLPIAELMQEVLTMTLQFLGAVLVLLLVVAIADFSFQRYQNYIKLRMTRNQVKEEFKQQEGDPHIKAKLKAIRKQRHMENMKHGMKSATFLVTNPTHYGVAVRYNPIEKTVPIVVAKGIDDVVFAMRKLAVEMDIPVIENPPLARSLYETTNVGEDVPQDLFGAVAAVLRYLRDSLGVKF